MRYVWASVVAIAIIGVGYLALRVLQSTVEQKLREATGAAGHPLPDGASPQSQNAGIEMSSSDIMLISATDFLFDFWYVFVGLVLLTCLGVAVFAGRPDSPAPK